MKNPTAGGKDSFPGALAVKLVNGVATAFPRDAGVVRPEEDLLQTVYDHGPVNVSAIGLLMLPVGNGKSTRALALESSLISRSQADF